MKKLTIITVTLNCESCIESTILSVINNKNFSEIQFVIIDGLSKDNTCKIIERYAQNVDFFISEPDSGIFDAMNKGTAVAICDWVMYLNAGDLLDVNFNNFDFDAFSDFGIIYGNTVDIGVGERKPFHLHYLKFGMILACHQSMIFNKKLLGMKLYYNLNYSSYNDFELIIRLLNEGYAFYYIDTVISHYLGGGVSTEVSTKKRLNKLRMMYNYYGLLGVVRLIAFKLNYKPKINKFEKL